MGFSGTGIFYDRAGELRPVTAVASYLRIVAFKILINIDEQFLLARFHLFKQLKEAKVRTKEVLVF